MIEAQLRQLQLVAAALVVGVLFFATVAVLLLKPRELAVPTTPLALAAIAAAGLALAVPALLRPSLVRSLRARAPGPPPPEAVLPAYRVQTVVAQACAEASALVGTVSWLLTGAPAFLALVPLAVALMAFRFPTADGFERFRAEVEGRPA